MKRFAIVLALLLCGIAANAGVYLEVKYGPWVTNVSETGFDVVWVTPDVSLAAVAVFPDDGTSYYAQVRPCFYETVVGRRVARNYHRIHVDGLQPGTDYRYRIFGKEQLSIDPSYALKYGGERDLCKEFKVRTLDKKAESCEFSIVNDIHANAERYRKLLAPLDRKETDFVVLNGDMVNSSHKIDTVIKYTYDVVKQYIAELPVFYVNGNHETRGSEFHLLPNIVGTPTGTYYYTFRQGPVAFLVLDGAEDKPDDSVEYSGTADFDRYRAEELEWLKQAVKDPEFNSAPYRIVFVHIPPLARQDAWYGEKQLHDKFLPVLNEAGIDIMFCAHMHAFHYYEKGDFDNAFPILVNSNTDRVDVKADAKGISVKVVGENGEIIKSTKL